MVEQIHYMQPILHTQDSIFTLLPFLFFLSYLRNIFSQPKKKIVSTNPSTFTRKSFFSFYSKDKLSNALSSDDFNA